MRSLLFRRGTTLAGIGIALALLPGAGAAVHRVKFQSGNNYLIVEVLTDDLLHFELSALGPGPDAGSPIFITAQVFKTDYAGPNTFAQSGPGGNTLDTADMNVVVDTTSLCLTATDKTKNLALTTICPLNLSQAMKGLTFTPGSMQQVYGLGEQFLQQSANGDWTAGGHQQRAPGDNFGNQMTPFGGGANGNAQIPVM